MLETNSPFYSTAQPWNAAIPAVIERMQQSGLRVMRTFDLQETRAVGTGCSCPHHSAQPCDCQMVVLLVYGDEGQPASLIASGQDSRTSISLAGLSGASNPALEDKIRAVLGS